MSVPHVFVETNFLFSVFQMPSKRDREALALRERFEAGGIKLYVPYLCLQETRNLIAKSLPPHRCTDLLDFHRYTASQGEVSWSFDEARKLLDAASGEVNRTKSVYKREIDSFALAVGDGLLHGTDEVFDFLETLDLEHDNAQLKFVDAMVLCCVLVKAKHLRTSGADQLFFASSDEKAFRPSAARPNLSRYYSEASLVFVSKFVLPEPPPESP